MMNEKKRRVITIVIVALLLCGSLLSLLTAEVHARVGADKRAESVLLDSAREQASTLASVLSGRLQVLHSLSTSLSLNADLDIPQAEERLQAIINSANFSFSSVDLLDADGVVALGGSASGLDVSDRQYFQQAMQGNSAIEFVTGRLSGDPCVMMAVPYKQNGEIRGAVRGLYFEHALRKLLTSYAYGGEGYSYVVDSQGRIVVHSEREHEDLTTGSIRELLSDITFERGEGFDDLFAGLGSGRSFALHFDENGTHHIATFTPLQNDTLPQTDWFILNIVSESSLVADVYESRQDTLLALFVFLIFSVAAVLLILLLERDYRQRQRGEAEDTRQREEQFRVVTEQSGKRVLRYDLKARAPSLLNAAGELDPDVWGLQADPAGAADCRAFVARLNAGQSPVSVSLPMLAPGGERCWYRFVSTAVMDAHDVPQTAIISYYDDTRRRDRELAYRKWQQELHSMPQENSALYEWNLTRDESEGQSGHLASDYALINIYRFNDRTDHFVKHHVDPQDADAVSELMNRERLLTCYFSGQYSATRDYRYLTDDGQIRWRRLTVQLVPYPDSQDVKAYITNTDIDAEKREALAILERSQKDFLTDALNRETFMQRVSQLIQQSPASTHALMMLDVDGFKQVNDVLGHDAGDRVLSEFVQYIRAALRSSDIVGRIGGDEFMVCLPDMPFDAAISKKARQLCIALKRKLGDRLTISASVGVAVYPRDGATFEELYRHADAALYQAKSSGKNNYAFYAQGMDTAAQQPDAAAAQEEAAFSRIVPVVTGDADLIDELTQMLAPDYDVVSVADGKSLLTKHEQGGDFTLVLLDADGRSGLDALLTDSAALNAHGLAIMALTGDPSDENAVRLLKMGATAIVTKPIGRELLRLRLDRMYLRRAQQSSSLQNAYQRLQSTEQTQYREVLRSTNTSVLIYDVQTHAYHADVFAEHPLLGGLEDGRRLGEELIGRGMVSAEDVRRVQEAMTAVETGEQRIADLNVHITGRDGESRWHRVRIAPMENDDLLTPKLILTINDVHEQLELDQKLRYRAERDTLTGLYNRETFFEKAAALIEQQEPGYYVIASVDVDNFKVINDQYGLAMGDEVLRHIADVFERGVSQVDGLCCRMMADNFALLYPSSYMETPELRQLRHDARRPFGAMHAISFSVGRYIVNDKSLDVNAMLSRASMAERSVKGRFDEHIALYDEGMRERLLREQEIINEMNGALEGGQFEAWYQPQYNHASGMLIGAEALVRWRHPQKGLIPPGVFIPVFERNGFVYELDKHIWQRVCADLRRWLDAGLAPLPASVNISRYDLLREDVYDVLTGLVKTYDLPVELLRLEITESAFAGSTDHIIAIVKKLTDYGFTVEIDDFGSGYSSLNTLKDVPASILKLDMRFLEGENNSQRGGNILESIVRMAKWLGMPVIAEGVETREQADFLKSIGCNYVQGYLYAKPMPVSEYESLSQSAGKERQMIALQTIKTLDNNKFWDPSSMETLIFNSYVGGACIFEHQSGTLELLRANEKFAQELCGAQAPVAQVLRLHLGRYMDTASTATFKQSLKEAIDTDGEITFETHLYGLPGRPGLTITRNAIRVIARAGDRQLFYCSVINTTAQREVEQKLVQTSEQMRVIMENVNGGISAVLVENDSITRFVFANERYFSMFGYTRQQFEAELRDAFELVHPDDRERTLALVQNVLDTREPTFFEYRCIRRDGSVINVRCNASITTMEGISGEVLLSVATDVTELTLAQRHAQDTSQRLRAIMDNVYGGVTAVVIRDGVPEYLYANDLYFTQLGYTRKQFFAEVNSGFGLIHPDDRLNVVMETLRASVSRKPFTCEYRAIRRDHKVIWLQSHISIIAFPGEKEPVQLSVASDITEQRLNDQAMRETSEQLQFLNDVSAILLTGGAADEVIGEALGKILVYFGGRRAHVFELDVEHGLASNTYEVTADGVPPICPDF